LPDARGSLDSGFLPSWGAAELELMVCIAVWFGFIFQLAWAAWLFLVGSLGSSECAMGLLWRSQGYEKMVAYSSIGHMGYVLTAAAAATAAGVRLK